MSKVSGSSSGPAYLFVSVNLIILLSFLIVSSLNLQRVDSTRDRYEHIVRTWFEFRLALQAGDHAVQALRHFDTFAKGLEGLLDSELLFAGARLSAPLAASGELVSRAWAGLEPAVYDVLTPPSRLSSDPRARLVPQIIPFQETLFGLESVLEEFVANQQRAIEILIVLFAAIIIATVGIFLYVERETSRERHAASRVQSLVQSTLGAQEQERARIARALHDSLAQELTVALLEVGEIERGGSPPAADTLRKRLRSAVDWIRTLAHDLHPSEIEQVGLAAALEAYCRELAESSGVHIDRAIPAEPCVVPRSVAINVYRVGQEALTNAIRHGRPHRVLVRLVQDDRSLVLFVSDDGRGFEPRDLDGDPSPQGMGIVGMRERALMLDATLDIESEPGRGTWVRLRVPLDHEAIGCADAS